MYSLTVFSSQHIITSVIFACYLTLPLISGQNIFERFRPSNVSRSNEDLVKVVSGTKVKRFERMTVPLGGSVLQPHLLNYGYGYVVPHWQASAKLIGDGDNAADGVISFQQLPYNNDIKVTINVTGLPPGKHALHIHTFGDLSEGCKSTGGQFPNNFIGNVDTKDDGSISAAFLSVYLNLFGFNGIVGRSVVIHSKPIDLNTALNAEVFSSSLTSVPDALAYQNEENSVGPPIACGIISIVRTATVTPEK
ncbi:superoxide dismutase [Cu-Zn]-like [Teleopsis dalmanni]|uniref:superoxide dismutase [Cu-Zn]-like n=1 Tax=Teleopsis dalmanni TaxID=139649 RepID=UPI0018CFCEB6|nr:superoxide dismutase [Cu-Zn]-like [Teleopsis dalmanni]